MDLHEAFETWLLRGTRQSLPRDVAVHASACPSCLRSARAFDGLAGIDTGIAEMPPIRVVGGHRRGGLLPATASIAVVVLVIGAGVVVGGTLFRTPPELPVAAGTPTPAGAVLGGQGSPQAPETASSSPSPTASSSPTPTPTTSPTASAGTGAAAPNPTMGGGPPPVVPGPTPTPRPRSAPTPRPSATPAPTAPPTPVQTPSPTAVPTATPCPLDVCLPSPSLPVP
jgi:hypothetical protein